MNLLSGRRAARSLLLSGVIVGLAIASVGVCVALLGGGPPFPVGVALSVLPVAVGAAAATSARARRAGTAILVAASAFAGLAVAVDLGLLAMLLAFGRLPVGAQLDLVNPALLGMLLVATCAGPLGRRIARTTRSALAGVRRSPADLPSVELATDADVHVGTPLLSIGYPASADAVTDPSLEPSNKDGQVSAKKTVGSVPVYETSAALTPGMSGGPTVDLDGRVLGLNSFMPAGESQAFNFVAPASGLTELLARNGVRAELGPDDKAFRAALDAYYAGHYTDAIARFDKLLQVAPQHAQAQQYRTLAAKVRDRFGDVPVAPGPPRPDPHRCCSGRSWPVAARWPSGWRCCWWCWSAAAARRMPVARCPRPCRRSPARLRPGVGSPRSRCRRGRRRCWSGATRRPR